MKVKLEKEKITMYITIAIECLILGLVMSAQFKVVNQIDVTSIETMRESELRTELASWKEKYEELNDKYLDTLAKISEYKETSESYDETYELLQKELSEINKLLGYTDVQGEGLIITIRDDETDITKQINTDDLITIVNALRLSGAEAISINDERIVNMSDIFLINRMYIAVNGRRVVSPYVIKAIGNKNYLESGLTGKGGYIDELVSLDFKKTLEKSDDVQILKYKDTIDTKYME